MMKELKIPAIETNLPRVLSFIEEQLDARGCPAGIKAKINIAAEEIFVNIAHYAYGQKIGPVVIRLDWEEDSHKVVLTFIDQGIPFNPLESADPDISMPLKQRKKGGLGIWMVKKTMEGLRYKHVDGSNVLSFEKSLLPKREG